ncbi:unnamed protein product, partial [Phaeothamnion confervicola]
MQLEVEDARNVFREISARGRPVSAQERQSLAADGCSAASWDDVRVLDGASRPAAAWLKDGRIRRCRFDGPVLLGPFSNPVYLPGCNIPQPSGCYNSTLAFVVVGADALVQSCGIVAQCVVKAGAGLVGCGLVAVSGSSNNSNFEHGGGVGGSRYSGGGGGSRNSGGGGCGSSSSSGDGRTTITAATTAFGNGMDVAVGPETGGREIFCHAEMAMSAAVAAAAAPRGSAAAAQRAAAAGFARDVRCPAVVFCSGARALFCRKLVDCFIGPHALLEGAEVVESTVLSSDMERTSVTGTAVVRHSLLQRGVRVDSAANVSGSVLMEHSSVARGATVAACVVGPDSGVEAGEAHHCLIGPFVGFHHQSLLIAAVWPGGRGNLGYGCNVGSNHTGRLPDQEVWPGEGQFFGLGSVVKFPADYSASPYTIVAAGVACRPQRVAFPFSLISAAEMLPGTGGSGAAAGAAGGGLNHLWPGWVLSKSMYTVARAEAKYRSRSTARLTRTDWPVFRRDVVSLVESALDRLLAASDGCPEVYMPVVLKGLGENFVTRKALLDGVAVYTLHLRRYALSGLLRRLEGAAARDPELKPAALAAEALGSGAADGGSNGIPGGAAGAPEWSEVPTAAGTALAAQFDLPGDGAAKESEAAAEWAYQRHLLVRFFPHGSREESGAQGSGAVGDGCPSRKDLPGMLRAAAVTEAAVAAAVCASKQRDDSRGRDTVPGYADVHLPAAEDTVVRAAQQE